MSRLVEVFSQEKIQGRVKELAAEINSFYAGVKEPLVAVCVLKGAFVFFADLLRALNLDLEIDFVRLASYGQETARQEKVSFSKDMEVSVSGKHVLIVEDIVDTGWTMAYLAKVLQARSAKSLQICALVRKRERVEIETDVRFCGFELAKGFIVGYGLDYAEKYRHLPGIYELV